ncbi:MAG TPA: hypothetical protein DCE47_21490 [Planctomycetaceae bacterium]|nr:hypothetical protein [Planctomycetaceae bacterium]HCD00142.1 hypothetical protein [Planctomycetaceae bacterium]|tara:strand:+ start:3304 stop:5193 length:1890 start_codon:yes stop_codon:yes gene_type:complete
MTAGPLAISDKTLVVPVIHGSGDFAVAVRRVMLERTFDCLAVPLPPSFQANTESALQHLPGATMVLQHESPRFETGGWTPGSDSELEPGDPESVERASYVPIDPCQPVIAALRTAVGEHIPRAFVDPETNPWEPMAAVLPDAYALKHVAIEQFASAILPALPRPPEGQPADRVAHIAARILELEQRHDSILLVCSVLDWPWIHEAYRLGGRLCEEPDVEETRTLAVDPRTLAFTLGELPFITGLYETARARLDDDDNLSIDGLKELLLETRDRYVAEWKSRARRITPQLLSSFFRYVRNLSLIERRLTPDLYTLVTAAKQVAGDEFAITLAETARDYAYSLPLPLEEIRVGIGRGELPGGEKAELVSRLPGPPVTWRTLKLKPRPPRLQQDEWQMQWDPHRQCSWPPEDNAIERFRTHVKDTAMSLLGSDLARSEKFTTSLRDGLDIRETLRNWHTGDLFVKVLPPTRGSLDCVLMFFDSPADPRDYPWRITWMAEHHDESTLALFATDFRSELAGPGIGMANYGGAMFLFPPRPVPEVWADQRFDWADTLEERLLAAACHYSRERHIAVLSHAAPGAAWRRIARQHGRKLIHVPLGRFSQETVSRLRQVHVLNGQEIRSFAAHFIRKA